MTIVLNILPLRTFKLLFIITLGLTIAHIIAVTLWYKDLLATDNWLYISFFDLDEEESIGTWFSSVILLIAGQLSFLVSHIYKNSHKILRIQWGFLALGFHLLSIDEIAGFHEFVNTMLSDSHWTTYALVLCSVVALIYIPFLKHLNSNIRFLMILSGGFYIGGAVFIEMYTIHYEQADQLNTLAYNLWNALEEFFEMFGIVLYNYTVLKYTQESVLPNGEGEFELKCMIKK